MKPLNATAKIGQNSKARVSISRFNWFQTIALVLTFVSLGFVTAQTNSASGIAPVNVASKADVALPLVSVGSSVGFNIGAEDYRLNVFEDAQNARLEVYSPEINLNDYANKRNRANYYGDELYAKNAKLETTFKVLDGKRTIIDRKFGSSLKHSFVQLYAGALTKGLYPMTVQSVGNGKNSFQIRASQGVQVLASQFTVNVRGQFGQDQLVAYLDIKPDAVGKKVSLENYDADGDKEMILSLLAPTGSRNVALSGNKVWNGNMILITPDLVGTWKILTRILPTTTQFSNSVAFRFRLDGKPLFARIPGFPTPKTELEPIKPPPVKLNPIGTLQVTSSANICGQNAVLQSGFTVNGKHYLAPTSLKLAPGNYSLQPENYAGSSSQSLSVLVKENAVSNVNLQYIVALKLETQPKLIEVQKGRVLSFEVQVSTAFGLAVPVKLQLKPSAGISLNNNTQNGFTSSDKPFQTKVVVSATQNGKIEISLGANCPKLEIPVNLLIPTPPATPAKPAKLSLTKTVNKTEFKTGETADFTITASNTGDSSVTGIKLSDVLPAGLSTENELSTKIDLKPGETRIFHVLAKVLPEANGYIHNTATLLGNNQTLNASASIHIIPEPTPTRPEPSLPPAPQARPARLTLAKTVDRYEVKRGEEVKFKIIVSNVGGSTASNIRVQDILPKGLTTLSNLETNFDLKAGESREFVVTARITETAFGVIVNTATLIGNNQSLNSSARVHVDVPKPVSIPGIKPQSVPVARLTLEKTVDKSEVVAGETVTYTITATNVGNASATAIQLTDVLPEGVSGESLNQQFDLRAGESRAFKISVIVQPNAIGTIRNDATLDWQNKHFKSRAFIHVRQTKPTPTPAPAPAPVPVPTVKPIPARLQLEKFADRMEAQPGQAVNFTIKVRNVGGIEAKDITLSDILPTGVYGTDLQEIFNLEAGTEREFSIPSIVTNGFSGQIINTAQLRWNNIQLNARAKVNVPKIFSPREILPASVRILKYVDQPRVSMGDTPIFTIIVTNDGEGLAQNVHLTDSLPEYLTGENLDQTFDLRPHQSRIFTVKTTVNSEIPETITNTAQVTFEGITLVDSASVYLPEEIIDRTRVIPPTLTPIIKLEKTVDKAIAKPLEPVMYTIKVSNVGDGVAKLVKLEDVLPGNVLGKNLKVLFNLQPNETRVFKIPTTLVASASGTITNTAVVNFNGTRLEASAVTQVMPIIDLRIRKTVTPNQVRLGDLVTYELEIENLGPSTATNVKVHDALPNGLNLLGEKPDQGQCQNSENTLDCELGTLEKGAKTRVVINATVTGKPGKLVNTATTNALETETTMQNNTDSVELEILPAALGILKVNAVTVLCGQRANFEQFNYTINAVTYKATEAVNLSPGTYTIQPEIIAGSSVQALEVIIKSNQTSSVTLEYQPKLELNLDPAKLELKLGERVTVTATVGTAFPYPLNVNAKIDLPDGLQASSSTTFAGVTRASQPAIFTVAVRAIKPVVGGVIRASVLTDCLTANSSITATANALPPETRESQILVLAKLESNPEAGYVILSDRIPANSSYISNSSRLLKRSDLDINQQPITGNWTPSLNQPSQVIPDPLVNADRLFWVIPAEQLKRATTLLNRKNSDLMMKAEQFREAFGVTYRVSHQTAITVPNDPAVILVLPTRSSSDTRVRVQPESALGKLVGNGELRLVEGKPEVLASLQTAQPISGVLSNSNTQVPTPQTVPSKPAVKLEIKLERPTNDPVDQPVLVVRVFDEDGNLANDQFATLEINVEVLTSDADLNIPGFQVKLENGVGKIRLRDIGRGEEETTTTTDIKAEARVTNENGTITSSLAFNNSQLAINSSNPLMPAITPVTSSERPLVASGLASVQFNLNFADTTEFSVSASLRAFTRGSLGDGWVLTAAINWQADINPDLVLSGTLLPSSNPYVRFPILGDASTTGSDVRSSEGIYLKLENGASYIMYGQITPAFTGLLSNYGPNFNGTQALARGVNYSVNGFAAFVPNANKRFKTQGDGTSFYRLPSRSIQNASERVVVVTYDKNNVSVKLSEVVQKRLADYTLDNFSGNLQLTKVLFSTDENGNPQFLEVEYAVEGADVTRELRFGVQAAILATPELSFSGTILQYKPGINPQYLLGLAVNYASNGFQATLETSFSGQPGNGGGLGLAAQASYTNGNFQIQGRYQDLAPGYLDPNTSSQIQGRNLELKAVLGDTKDFSINAALNHNQDYLLGTSNTKTSLRLEKNFDGFSANIGLLLQFNHVPTNLFPLSTDLYLTFGATLPLGNWKFGFLQRVPLISLVYGDTTLSVEYALSSNFGIKLSDTLTYEPNFIRQALNLGVTGSFSNLELLRVFSVGNLPTTPEVFGTTTFATSYETSNTSGDAGRARIGLDTDIPLGNNWSAQLGGETVFATTGTTGSISLGARYATDPLQLGAKAQFGFSSTGIKQVYTVAGIAKISNELTISPSLEYDVLPEFTKLANGIYVRDGGRYSIAAAWRSDDWSALTNHTGRFGIYAPDGDVIQGEIQFGYNGFERLFIRAGAAYKLNASAFTGQVSAGFNYFVTNEFGIGANAAYQFQPATGTGVLSFGVEASYRLLNGFVMTGGFNFIGFQGISSFNTAPGFFIRFDWKFDERLFYGK